MSIQTKKEDSTPLKVQGLFTVIAAIAIQLTLGIAHIWSVFQSGVAKSIFNGNSAMAALTFAILLALLTIGSVIGGLLAKKFGTRKVVFAGGIILSLGFLLAGFVTSAVPWALWLTYGVMGGVGMGFTYSTTIACAQKWYPHKKGLVTGIIVSALGFGGVVFTPIIEAMIKGFGGSGTGEGYTFMVLAAIFLVVCSAGSLFLKSAPEGYLADKVAAANAGKKANANKPAAKNYTATEILKTPQFYLITFTFMLACMGGLMMIGFAKDIAIAKGLGETAFIGVMIISMFNSLGRLIWGIVSDKLGRVNTIFILLAGSAVLSPIVLLMGGYWIYVIIAFIGFFYGGLLSTFPSLTADTFGAKNNATNYGFVLLGFGAGAVIALQIAGVFRDIAKNDINLMFPAFIIGMCAAVAGIVMMFVFKMMNKKKEQEVSQSK